MRPLLLLGLLASACVDLTPPTPLLGDGGDARVQDARADADRPVMDGSVDELPDALDGSIPDGTEERDAGPAGNDGGPGDDAAADVPVDDAAGDLAADVSADVSADAALLANGSSCGLPGQCASGHCIRGLCCDSACGALCQACDLPASRGTCSPVPASTPCQAASCTGTTYTPAATCDGAGTCRPAAPSSCAPYACAPSACATSCASFASCAPGVSCNGSVCSSLPGLVLHWRLDEATGSVARDSSGNGFDGTYVGSVGTAILSSQVPPLRYSNDRSREFTMASRHAVWLPNAPAALRPPSNLTISLWYRATALDVNPSNGAPFGSELLSLSDTYLVRLRASINGVSTAKLTANGFVSCEAPAAGYLNGAWHHVAVVISSTSVVLYYGGNALCSAASALPISYERGYDLWVGRHGLGQTQWDFGGNLDEIRIYNRALSSAEIAVLAGGGS